MGSSVNLAAVLLAVLCYSHFVFGLKIISKSEWGGRRAARTSRSSFNLNYAIIHHSDGSYCSTLATCKTQMRNIQNYHMNTKKWSDIGYNFGIGGDGSVFEGRGFGVIGAHALNWNSKSIGIMFLGNYNVNRPTAAQIAAAKALLAYGVSRGYLSPNYTLYGHRQVGSTECPGNNLYNEIKKWSNWKA